MAPTPKDTPPPKPAAAPKDPRGTAARIRKAARALFLEHGYGGTSMDAIAAAAPVSKRTLYQHFPGKAELFGAVISESWSHLTGAPLLPSDIDEDPRIVLRAYLDRLQEHWDRPDIIPLLRLVIAEAPRFPELSRTFFAAGKEPAVQGLSVYLASLVRAGRLPAGTDPALAAAQFLGAIKEPLFWPRVLGVPVAYPARAAVEHALDALLGPAVPPSR